ncbi:filamentous hemagglutinin N-terminal domain-containing protein [Pseudomonas fluorescens]|uniref:two-partner secretion domain-containing protein n=1 Tax=Pseudomonas fluorescens TaxID=294 RepID=UPI0019308FA7|nr:filamentous hemagglutinin N-terminal domain-containing protein [Pseudomonas fluorescens]MBD8088772.1 filamentous hemagglutinin N-terminal domain-containing protein [Pseudomonas fluorescens]
MIKRSPLAVAIATAVMSYMSISGQAYAIEAGALPDVGNASVTYGSADITSGVNHVAVDATNSSGVNGNTLIEWGGNGFNVGRDASVDFSAQNNASILLNYDVSGKLSTIDGNINANQGNVVIVNPNGIEHTGSGNARLTLLAAEPGNVNFGLDKSPARIEVYFDNPDAVIKSNIEGMLPTYDSENLNIQSNGVLQVHSNASSLGLYGFADEVSYKSILDIQHSRIFTNNLYMSVDPVDSNFYGGNEREIKISDSYLDTGYTDGYSSTLVTNAYDRGIQIDNSQIVNTRWNSGSYRQIKVTNSLLAGNFSFNAASLVFDNNNLKGTHDYNLGYAGRYDTDDFVFTNNHFVGLTDADAVYLSFMTKDYRYMNFDMSNNTFGNLSYVDINLREQQPFDGGGGCLDCGVPTLMSVASFDEKDSTPVESGESDAPIPVDSGSGIDGSLVNYVLKMKDQTFTDVDAVSVSQFTPNGRAEMNNFTATGDVASLQVTTNADSQGMTINDLKYVSGLGNAILGSNSVHQNSALRINNSDFTSGGSMVIQGGMELDGVNMKTDGGFIGLVQVPIDGHESSIKNSTFQAATGDIYTTTAYEIDDSNPGDIRYVNKNGTVWSDLETTIAAPQCAGVNCVTSTTGELTTYKDDKTGVAEANLKTDNTQPFSGILFTSKGGAMKLSNSAFIIGEDEVIVPVEPEVPEVPAEPETPVIPEVPAEPETPVIPEVPAEPETPVIPEVPVEPETPVIPEVPAEPETPVIPEVPAEPETPVIPELPVEPETPVIPEVPAEPETPVIPEAPAEPETPVIPEVPTTPEVPVVVPPVVEPPVVTPTKPVKTPKQITTDALIKAQSAHTVLTPDVIVLEREPSKDGFVRKIGAFFGLVSEPEKLESRIKVESE